MIWMMVLLQSSVALSLCVLGLSLSLVSGQSPIRLSVAGESNDLTARIVSFTVFDATTPFICHTTNTPGSDWFDPEGDRMWPGRFGVDLPPAPTDNQIWETGVHLVGINLYRGANYFTLDGQWCCGLVNNANFRRCVTFTPCPTLDPLTNGVFTYNRNTNVTTYSCNSGYRLEGNGGSTTRTCTQAVATDPGTWSGSQPSCVVNCGSTDLTDPMNGMVSFSDTTVESIATYSCDNGYDLVGSATRTCGADRMWTPAAPTCQITDCGPLTPPPHGSISTLHGSTTVGSLVMYSCDSCSDLVGIANQICFEDGNWNPGAPTCSVRNCSPPPPPVNGGVTLSPDSSCGSQVIYHCDPGYLMMGSDARTCQPSGDWSGSAPVCNPVNCGSPSDPPNGQVLVNSMAYLGVATYSCDSGYTLTGSRQRTCNKDGEWTPNSPRCNPVDCGSLDPPANGQVDTSFGTTFTCEATYSCYSGYFLVGEAVRTCRANGKWQPEAPACIIVDCGRLSHPVNGAVSTVAGTTYNSVALYSCDDGYKINGPSQRTCTPSGNWTDYPPTCDAVDCGELIAPSHGSVDTPEGTLFLSVASYSCDPGYNLTGCSTAQCQADGTWSCDPPFCADNVYIQLKFGPTSHCVDWSEKRVELLYTKMQSLILRAIQRYGNNKVLPKENITPGYFSCFLSTTQASYRTRITGTESVSAVEYAAMIQSWVESGVSSRLQWYIIKFDKKCPVRIESMEEDECN